MRDFFPAVAELFSYDFVRHALIAGAFTALLVPVVGFFLLNRGMTFAAHALPNIGFAGAAGAVLLGLDPLIGLFVFTVGASLGFGLAGQERRDRDIGIGIVMVAALGLGLLFLAAYSGFAERAYSVLFGSILGIGAVDMWISVVSSLLTLGLILLFYRPLLFSTVDPELALARGIRVRLLGFFFLILVAVTVSISIRITGSLLVFTLLVGPAASAMRLSSRPPVIMGIGILIAELVVFVSIVLAGLVETIPVSFFIASITFVVYLAVRIATSRVSRRLDP